MFLSFSTDARRPWLLAKKGCLFHNTIHLILSQQQAAAVAAAGAASIIHNTQYIQKVQERPLGQMQKRDGE